MTDEPMTPWPLLRPSWTTFYAAEVAQARCPYSGLLIVTCHSSDLCDCFDFTERAPDGQA
jgi:hypothetical protein